MAYNPRIEEQAEQTGNVSTRQNQSQILRSLIEGNKFDFISYKQKGSFKDYNWSVLSGWIEAEPIIGISHTLSLSDGRILITFAGSDGETSGLHAHFIEPDGSYHETGASIFDGTPYNLASDPWYGGSIASCQLRNGNVVVVYVDSNKDIKAKIMQARYSNMTLNGVISTITIDNDAIINDNITVDVKALANGNFIVAYGYSWIPSVVNYEMKYKIYDSSGTLLHTQIIYTGAANIRRYVKLGILTNGNIVIAFQYNDGESNSVYYRVYDENNNLIKSYSLGETGIPQEVIPLDNGYFVVLFYADSPARLRFRIVDSYGETTGLTSAVTVQNGVCKGSGKVLPNGDLAIFCAERNNEAAGGNSEGQNLYIYSTDLSNLSAETPSVKRQIDIDDITDGYRMLNAEMSVFNNGNILMLTTKDSGTDGIGADTRHRFYLWEGTGTTITGSLSAHSLQLSGGNWVDNIHGSGNDLATKGYIDANFFSLNVVLHPEGTTINDRDFALVDSEAISETIQIPAGTANAICGVKNISPSTVVYVKDSGEGTIDGFAQITLGEQYKYVIFVCDGQNWHIFSENFEEASISSSSSSSVSSSSESSSSESFSFSSSSSSSSENVA